jgi:hypothetical protein
MTEWGIQGARVYSKGEGKSYNCPNKITAQDLYHTLTTYENTITTLQKQIKHSNNYKELQKQVIALQMDISNCQSDLNKIKELLE